MSDRFEAAAEEYLENEIVSSTIRERGGLARAFRWYHDKIVSEVKATVMGLVDDGVITRSRAAELLDMSVSALIEQKKETCEYERINRADGAVHGYEWHPACCRTVYYYLLGNYCPDCGRRIVEVK
jgi:hypothetical protein